MQRPLFGRTRSPRVPTAATFGVLASASLLAAWMAVSRLAGPGIGPEVLLLDFVAAFIMIFGAMVVAAAVVGWLPIRGTRRPGR